VARLGEKRDHAVLRAAFGAGVFSHTSKNGIDGRRVEWH
jgi:hypothetical protein